MSNPEFTPSSLTDQESCQKGEKPFEGLQVYYCGSIRGVPESDPEIHWKLVRFMADRGANVLSEHVAGRNDEEREEIRASRIGERVKDIIGHPEPWFAVREIDLEWVDQASHVVALINSPSLGVGMEIQHALLKPERGLPSTHILCLVREDLLESLTYMARGIRQSECSIRTYTDLDSAVRTIHDFLTGALSG